MRDAQGVQMASESAILRPHFYEISNSQTIYK